MMRSRGEILSVLPTLSVFSAVSIAFPLDMGVTGQYLFAHVVLPVSTTSPTESPPVSIRRAGLTTQGSRAMKQKALQALSVVVGVLVFAAGGGQPGGLNLVFQQ